LGKLLQKIWLGNYRPSALAAMAIGLGPVALAGMFRLAIDHLVGPGHAPTAPFYPAVLFAALIGGEAATIAAVAAFAFVWLFLVPPPFPVVSAGEIVALGTYAAALALIAWGGTHYRHMLLQLREEEHHRKIVVGELGHRVKNKLATIYAIMSRELRAHPELWSKIDGRLSALIATDDFIARSDGSGPYLRDILMMESAPYFAPKSPPSSWPCKCRETWRIVQ
jgi:hypothetical protein